MKTFRISFVGRLIGSIGAFQKFTARVKAEGEEAAKLSLYNTHEHIRITKISEV